MSIKEKILSSDEDNISINNTNITHRENNRNTLIEFENDSINENLLLHDFNLNDIDEMDVIFDEIVKKELELITIEYKIKNDNQIIIDSNLKKSFKTTYLKFSCYDCDPNGKLINSELRNLQDQDLNIKNAKEKIIISYLKSKGVNDVEIKQHVIVFSCNLCNKNNKKCYIFPNTFKIGTHSHSDCKNETHEKLWVKWTKELKKIWNDSKEKSKLVFNMNEDYIINQVRTFFPIIIKQSGTGILFKWNGKTHYEEMFDNGIKSEIESLIYKYFKKDNNEVLTTNELRDVKSFILRSDLFPEKDFESSKYYNCKNGILNIKTRELKPHDPKYFFNYCSDINYNVNADPEELHNFIKSVVSNKNPIDLISKVLGHIHYSGEKLHKGFLFHGTKRGRNGKGTLVKLITKVIGQQRTLSTHLSMFNKSSFATYDLNGKALYIEDDYKMEYLGNEMIEFLNTLISQGSETVHQKNKPAIQIQHTAIPLIQCNKRPKIKAMDDGGFYDRWITIYFSNEFGDNMNEFLGSYLTENENIMSSMLNLLIDGYHAILERKKGNQTGSFFGEFDDEKNSIKEWKKENNSVLQFIDDCCELNNMYCCSSRELYLIYSKEWNLNGSKLSETKFVRTIKEELKIDGKFKKIKGKGINVLLGIKCNINTEFNTYQNLEIVNK